MQNNPYLIPRVILAPVLDEIQSNDSNLEPPMVRIRAANSAILALDSSLDVAGSSSQFVLGGGDQPPIASRRIKRLSMTNINSALNSPNVNDRNSEILFRTSLTGWVVDHIATIQTGYYYTVTTAVAALLVALNNCTPVSGLVFTQLPYNPASLASDPNRRRLQTPVGQFFTFGSDSGMGRYGRYLYGIPFLTPLGPTASHPSQYAAQGSNNLPIGQILLLATRWIDVLSETLTSYTKNPSTGNNLGNGSLIARLFIQSGIVDPIVNFPINYPVWINFERGRQIGAIDIQLIDEFGLPLFRDSLGKSSIGDPQIAREFNNDYTLIDIINEL